MQRARARVSGGFLLLLVQGSIIDASGLFPARSARNFDRAYFSLFRVFLRMRCDWGCVVPLDIPE